MEIKLTKNQKVSYEIENECWICNSHARNTYEGYYQIKYEKKKQLLHRLIYQIYYNEELTKDDVIMHTCDNPLCINPLHLKKGTQADNIHDCCKKNRKYKKISDDEVKLIRDDYFRNKTADTILKYALLYNCSLSYMRRVAEKKIRINI